MFHLRESDRGWLYGLATEVLVGAVFPPRKMTVWRFARVLLGRVAVVEFMHFFRQCGVQLEQDASDDAHRVMAERLEEIRAEPYAKHKALVGGQGESTDREGLSGERYKVRVTRQWAKRFRGPIEVQVTVREYRDELVGLLTERVLVAPGGVVTLALHRGGVA